MTRSPTDIKVTLAQPGMVDIPFFAQSPEIALAAKASSRNGGVPPAAARPPV